MKKFVLITLGIISWGMLQAQDCMPDENVPDSVVVSPLPYNEMARPDGGIQDTACVGSYYETVFTFNIPAVYEAFGQSIALQSAEIPVEGGISGLPASMDYICNPPNCVFPAEEKGCVLVFGTPEEGETGVTSLSIQATIKDQSGLLEFDLNLPSELEAGSEYLLHVKEEGFENCAVVSTQEAFAAQFELRNQPNPFSDFTQIMVNAQEEGRFELLVTDLLGQVIHRRPVQLFAGENTIDFDGSSLPEGMYLYSISDGQQAVSGKMILNR